ncbi:MAG: hypothetical protein IPK75_18115 [Acidobacteria bacterium]|nr:hypothetical protein [Acidobacteriota bacterium]
MLFAEVLGDPSPAGKTPIDLVYEAGAAAAVYTKAGKRSWRASAQIASFEARVREALAKHGLEW